MTVGEYLVSRSGLTGVSAEDHLLNVGISVVNKYGKEYNMSFETVESTGTFTEVKHSATMTSTHSATYVEEEYSGKGN